MDNKFEMCHFRVLVFSILLITYGCNNVRTTKVTLQEFKSQWKVADCVEKKEIAIAIFNVERWPNREPVMEMRDGKYAEALEMVVSSLGLLDSPAGKYVGFTGEIPMYDVNGVRFKQSYFTFSFKEFAISLRDSVNCP